MTKMPFGRRVGATSFMIGKGSTVKIGFIGLGNMATAIIGGMIIRIGDRVVDSSVRTKLNGLKKQLLQIQLG